MVCTFSARLFSYDKADMTFSAEASDLVGGSSDPLFHSTPTNPRGLTVHGLNVAVEYVLSKTDRDEEGDIRFWELVPTQDSLNRVRACHGTRVVVFND